jgi:hypothetical protein
MIIQFLVWRMRFYKEMISKKEELIFEKKRIETEK